jgi:subtilisin family serine protease
MYHRFYFLNFPRKIKGGKFKAKCAMRYFCLILNLFNLFLKNRQNSKTTTRKVGYLRNSKEGEMNKLVLLSLCTVSGLAIASDANYVEGEILVKFKPGKEKLFFQKKSISNLGISPSREINTKFEHINILKINTIKANYTMDEILKNLRENSDVVYAEPNYIYTINPIKASLSNFKKVEDSQFFDMLSTTPDDPQFSKLWGLQNTGSNEPKGSAGVEGADVNALKAWDITTGSKKVKIAVIDTGVDYNHPDLKGNVWVNEKELNGKPGVDDDGDGFVDDIHGYNFSNDTPDPLDGHGHGTHCSGTIGAIHDNKVGVAGVMSDVTIVPVKFLGDDGSGTLEAAVKAIDYATS